MVHHFFLSCVLQLVCSEHLKLLNLLWCHGMAHKIAAKQVFPNNNNTSFAPEKATLMPSHAHTFGIAISDIHAIFYLFSLSFHDWLIKNPNTQRIIGEVWSVDEQKLAFLDFFEGYPDYYDRLPIDVQLFETKNKDQKVPNGRILRASVYVLKEYKEELLQRQFYSDYDSYGDHNMPYSERLCNGVELVVERNAHKERTDVQSEIRWCWNLETSWRDLLKHEYTFFFSFFSPTSSSPFMQWTKYQFWRLRCRSTLAPPHNILKATTGCSNTKMKHSRNDRRRDVFMCPWTHFFPNLTLLLSCTHIKMQAHAHIILAHMSLSSIQTERQKDTPGHRKIPLLHAKLCAPFPCLTDIVTSPCLHMGYDSPSFWSFVSSHDLLLTLSLSPSHSALPWLIHSYNCVYVSQNETEPEAGWERERKSHTVGGDRWGGYYAYLPSTSSLPPLEERRCEWRE